MSPRGRWIIGRKLNRLDWVIKEIAETEHRLAEVTQDDHLVRALQTFKGIGPVTTWTIRAEIGRCDRFRNGKQLSRAAA